VSANDGNGKLLQTVRSLIAKANNTEFEEEAAAFRAKADELMVKYAITHYDLDADHNAKQSKFGAYEFSLNWYWEIRRGDGSGDELRTAAYSLMLNVARHCRLMTGPFKNNSGDLILIGLKSDFEFFEMMFTSLYLEMTRMMLPQYDQSKSIEENVVIMKHAGYKWGQISMQLAMHGNYPQRWQKNGQEHGCYIAMYKKGLKALGLEQIKIQPQVHARSFCMGFNGRLSDRMRAQKAAIEAEPGNALVLMDMSAELKEWALNAFPDHFNPPKGKKLSRGRVVKVDYGSMAQGRAAGDKVDLGGSKLGQRKELQ
jgi:hypothetical protein